MRAQFMVLLFLSLIMEMTVADRPESSKKCICRNDICDICGRLTGDTYSESRNDCEQRVDKFLHTASYCKHVTASTKPSSKPPCTTITTTMIPTTIISPSLCSITVKTTVQHTRIVTPSLSCPKPSIATCTSDLTSSNTKSLSSSTTALNNSLPATTIALGALTALLALSVVLLAIVITGWVCTCLVTKKRARIKELLSTEDAELEEKYFENPTYDGISSNSTTQLCSSHSPTAPVTHQQAFSGVTYTTYDAVNTQLPRTTQKKQTYDMLNREKANGKQTAARSMETAKGDKGYSQPSLLDKDVENNYHLITKELQSAIIRDNK